MKKGDRRYEKRGRRYALCVLFLFGVLISALSLGGIRLYALYLEHRLADCSKKIEAVGDEYAMLEEYYASLLSPSRIYNYAKSELNMVTASEVEIIRLISESYKGREITGSPAAILAPGELSRALVGTANAKD
jgi:cell division protein FtsL